jgi:hypothetical protein
MQTIADRPRQSRTQVENGIEELAQRRRGGEKQGEGKPAWEGLLVLPSPLPAGSYSISLLSGCTEILLAWFPDLPILVTALLDTILCKKPFWEVILQLK